MSRGPQTDPTPPRRRVTATWPSCIGRTAHIPPKTHRTIRGPITPEEALSTSEAPRSEPPTLTMGFIVIRVPLSQVYGRPVAIRYARYYFKQGHCDRDQGPHTHVVGEAVESTGVPK